MKIYTDGSYRRKTQMGGYGVVVLSNDEKELLYYESEQFPDTTNNRMEILALLRGIAYAKEKGNGEYCMIFSDSSYCVNMYNSWIENWFRNDWVRQDGGEVKNLDLVKELYEHKHAEAGTFGSTNYSINHIRGHKGNMGNEIADALAADNQDKFLKLIKEFSDEVIE